jgi:mRNA-degrading endonuclease RelE of RelBE toxin-antitoxin system
MGHSMRDVFFTGEFKRNLRQLVKKYRHIKTDIQSTLNALEIGTNPGDQIPGIAFKIYKVRIRNSDSTKGKRGGYRLIYQETPDNAIILITIYAKTEQSDISPQEIQAIINTYEQKQTTEETKQDPISRNQMINEQDEQRTHTNTSSDNEKNISER